MFRSLLYTSVYCLLLLFSLTTQAENTNFSTVHFSGSGTCASCHDGLTDTAGENVSIARDWGTSMMANATKDPFWQAKVATELDRNPNLSSVINDKCSQCHAPMANYETKTVSGTEVKLFGPDGILDPNHAFHDAAMNGISCTLCHQITDDASLGTLDGFSGQYTINQSKTIYGPFIDIFGQVMTNNTGYTPTYSAHISDSALCAVCHNLKTPFVDDRGDLVSTTPESEFPEQMPYTEWQQSIYNDTGSNPTSCQDCHMPKTTAKVANRPRWLGSKAGFAKHHLVGANTVMLTMLKNNAAQLDVTSPNLDLGISRARNMLQSAADIAIVSASVNNGVLEAQIKLENKSGHKVPTSFPSRRTWLHFKVTDSNGNVIFESGGINPDGSITGADNDVNQTVFEPHYDLITSADQVQIYETIMGDSNGNVTYTLLRAAEYLKDNRLTPKGFNKFNVPSDVAVRGEAFNDADFNLGSDEVIYRIPVTVAGDLHVNVSLNYQTIAHGIAQDLFSSDHLEQVQTFKTLYEAQSLKHEQIVSAQAIVVNDGGGVPAVPTVALTVSPTSIDPGQSATLSWASTDANSCVASGDWIGSHPTSGTEMVSPTIASTYTYTLTCEGDGGSATDSVTLTVNAVSTPVPVVNLSVSPTTIDVGQSATLSWTATDANSCVASGDWIGSYPTSGTELVSPTIASTYTYTLTCEGDGGNATDSVTLIVNQPPSVNPPTVTLTASPSRVTRGGTITLSWSSTDANSCIASGDWSGVKATTGSESMVISNPVTFTLSCSGDAGTASDTVSYRSRGRSRLILR